MDLSVVIAVLVVGMLVGIMLGIPVAFVLITVGLLAYFLGEGVEGVKYLGSLPWGKSFSFTIIAIPLFVFMGYLLQGSGIVVGAFRLCRNFVSWLPGSVMVAATFTAGAFAAMSGSGAAAAATLGIVTGPEAFKSGYTHRFVAGCLNAGASLAPIIPPSVYLIFYSTLTDQSVIELFMAALVPGLIVMFVMVSYIIVYSIFRPPAAPASSAVGVDRREKIASLRVLPGLAAIIFTVLGGIMLGWFTPTEAASVGVIVACLAILISKKFNLRTTISLIWESAGEATTTASYVMLLIVCGFIYSQVLVYFRLPHLLAESIGLGLALWQFYAILIFILLILGMFLDALTITVIVVPLLLPLLTAYGINLVWFGVVVAMMIQVGTMTPPFGLHIFILQGVLGVSYKDAVLGAFPFAIVWLFTISLLLLWPQIALWLPGILLGGG